MEFILSRSSQLLLMIASDLKQNIIEKYTCLSWNGFATAFQDYSSFLGNKPILYMLNHHKVF